MDSYDIFNKLSNGFQLNFKKQNANKLKTPDSKENSNTFEKKINGFLPKSKTEAKRENQNVVFNNLNNQEITLLGTIKSSKETIKKHNKKKQTISKEEKEKLLLQEQINHLRKINKIYCHGKNIPSPINTFEELSERYGVRSQILTNIQECGYTTPTPIQMQAFSIMLERRPIMACAPTGSGKTCAFLVPVIHHLTTPLNPKERPISRLRALIVCPTRELAKQTYRECLRLIIGTGLSCQVMTKMQQNFEKLGKKSKKFDILVTTPNRLVYLLKFEANSISLENLEWLIVDEADKLFETFGAERSFRKQLAFIYRACLVSGEKLQKAFFSATYRPEVANWASKQIKKIIRITVGQRNSASELVEQKLEFVGNESGKLLAFRQLVKQGIQPPVLVFVQTKQRAKELFNELIYDGLHCDVIHADRTQQQRDNSIRAFREGRIWILICTEILSRGIDFKGINLVINYDVPPSILAYIHRIGRTGRAGRRGKAITYFTRDDKDLLKPIIRVMQDSGCEIPDYLQKLKNISKRKRRQLESHPPERKKISTKPLKEKQKEKSIKKKILMAKKAKME